VIEATGGTNVAVSSCAATCAFCFDPARLARDLVLLGSEAGVVMLMLVFYLQLM
jgi:hypothetical protein